MNTDLEAVVRYRRDHAAAEAARGRAHADRNRDSFWETYARANAHVVDELTACLVQAGLEKPASWHHEAQADREVAEEGPDGDENTRLRRYGGEVAAETELERQAAMGR